jgi:RimJ/RimL family protein N-acetyltransferase
MKRPIVPDQLETDRLILRCPKLEDTALIFESARESLDELKLWMPWATENFSLDDAESFVRRSIAQYVLRENLTFSCFDKTTGRHICNSGLHRINWDVPRFEIGYWCRSSETGKGYVTEVVRALSKLCFELKAARVEIRCDDLNFKSAAVAERCGFTLEGVLKNNERNPNGELRSTRVYALSSLADVK